MTGRICAIVSALGAWLCLVHMACSHKSEAVCHGHVRVRMHVCMFVCVWARFCLLMYAFVCACFT